MPAPAEIVQLVELFERNYAQYRSPAFTEAAVRHQFIDPFFLALGWDVNNAQGFAEQYKEVVHEDKVKMGGATKAPDYSFRIGKERKFFVEAKKPAVDIQHDIEPAYQLRRYAWSAKLPLSILTDFEEFSVYDCRSKPAATDKASAGRILLLNYKELECCVLTRLAQVLCCERHPLLGKEARKDIGSRLALLELVVNLQHEGLNERLALLTTRLPDGFGGQVTFRR